MLALADIVVGFLVASSVGEVSARALVRAFWVLSGGLSSGLELSLSPGVMVLSDSVGGSVSGGVDVCGGSGFLNRLGSSTVSCVSMVDGVPGSLSP